MRPPLPLHSTASTSRRLHNLTAPEQLLLALSSCDDVGGLFTSTVNLADPALITDTCTLASKHGVLGLALVALEKRRVIEGCPAELGVRLNTWLKQARRQALLWQLECASVLKRLNQAGLHPVVLKGAALQEIAYNDPAERVYGDIDLLLPEQEATAAMDALRPIGYVAPADHISTLYRKHHFHYVLEKQNGFKVEVHWALERPASPFRLDPQVFLDSAHKATSTIFGEFVTPSTECAALHMCVQNVENGFARLSRLVDVDRLVRMPGFDWELFTKLATNANARVVVEFSLQIVHDLLGTPLPPNVHASLDSSRAARWHLSLLQPTQLVLDQTAYARPAVEALVNMWCRDTMRARGVLLGEILQGSDALLTVATKGKDSIRSGYLWNGVALVKMILYQLWLYGLTSKRIVSRTAA